MMDSIALIGRGKQVRKAKILQLAIDLNVLPASAEQCRYKLPELKELVKQKLFVEGAKSKIRIKSTTIN